MNKDNTTPLFDDIYPLEDGNYYDHPDHGSIKFSQPICVLEKTRDLDTDEMSLKLQFDSFGKNKYIIAKRDECLDINYLMSIQKMGLDIHPFNKNLVLKHILNEERLAETINSHSKIGFGEYEGDTIYKLHGCTGIDSIYTGKFDVEPKGSKEEWLQMFEEEVQGNSCLELTTSMSLSSIVIGFIGEKYSLETLIVHIYGNSSTGKTTALRLGISMFGSPKISNNSLFSTYNMTENAMSNRLGGTKGLTFAFDEISTSNINNFTKTIYTLASGIDKARLNKNSELREQGTWLGTIFSNGEKSLLNSANKNAGLQIRVVELEQDSWTSNSENAERINEVISNNYGHIAIEFAELLIKLGKEYVCEIYESDIQKLKKVMEKQNVVDEFSNRRANKLATILTTSRLFQKYLDEKTEANIKLNINGMIKILIESERESIKSRNLDKSAYEHIRQYVINNKHKFETNFSDNRKKHYTNSSEYSEQPRWEIIGKLTKKKDYIELEMTPNKFEVMLKEGGFEDKKVVLKELKKKGILDCDKDRYTRKRLGFGSISTSMIVVKLARSTKNVKTGK